MRALVIYMPVIHRGYLEFLERHAKNIDVCLFVGLETLSLLGEQADYLVRKDRAIRGLPEAVVKDFLRYQGYFSEVAEVQEADASAIAYLVGPDEDITQIVASTFFPQVPLSADDAVRLRYDRKGVDRVDPIPASDVTTDEACNMLMGYAETQAEKSRDWWLSVGAAIVRDGDILFSSCNVAVPDERTTAALGDPRSLGTRGQGTDDSIANHAERSLVAQAARKGVSLLGADAYVTHFPCVTCASSLGEAGIKRVFFRKGYSRLESAVVLESYGIEIIRVIP